MRDEGPRHASTRTREPRAGTLGDAPTCSAVRMRHGLARLPEDRSTKEGTPRMPEDRSTKEGTPRMQLAPSLHRLGSSSLVNSYLVEEAGAITVIDAGLRGHWKDLLRELEAMRRSPSDIRALMLTHGDVDLVGFPERLRQEHGVQVLVGAADAAEARGEVPKPAAVKDQMRLAPMARFLVYALTHGGLRTTPIKEVTSIAGTTTLDVPGAPTVIPLPGHTPGSVAYHVPSVDAIFMGDAMTTRSVTTGIVGPALGPFTVDPVRAVASLDALDGLSASWVLPGHGEAWTRGLPEALQHIRAAWAKRVT
jgi:glyoxylase-like metal-dependent hydrolase (beta-lactamase superfamily II)